MNAEDEKQNRFHASLAVYSKSDLIGEVSKSLGVKPSRSGKKNDYFFGFTPPKTFFPQTTSNGIYFT